MNRHVAHLLKANAERLVPAIHVHTMYRLLKREWNATPHHEKAALRDKLERGLKLYLHPDTAVPAIRAKFKAAEERRKARAKRREFEKAGGPGLLLAGLTADEARQVLKERESNEKTDA